MLIRKFAQDDIDSVLKIWLGASIKSHDFVPAQFWEDKIEMMRKTYLPSSETFVCEENDQILGFYSLVDNNLAAIFVDVELQGVGIGKKMLEDAKDKRLEINLSVYKKNKKSLYFYLRNDFKIIQEQMDVNTNEIEILMNWKK